MAAAADAGHKPFVGELLGRGDFAIIGKLVAPNSKVLDLGCGEGELLAWLAQNKAVDARGVEISATKVRRAITRGVSAYQGDIDEVLADYSDHAFDYVILSQTLQETRWPLKVMRDMMRVGRHAIVAFPNFGHWSVRLSLLLTGRAPKTDLFPHEWFDSPNIHFLTVDDFDQLTRQEGFTVERCYFLSGRRRISVFPNFRAKVAVYLVRK